jgi:hypothetical protein
MARRPRRPHDRTGGATEPRLDQRSVPLDRPPVPLPLGGSERAAGDRGVRSGRARLAQLDLDARRRRFSTRAGQTVIPARVTTVAFTAADPPRRDGGGGRDGTAMARARWKRRRFRSRTIHVAEPGRIAVRHVRARRHDSRLDDRPRARGCGRANRHCWLVAELGSGGPASRRPRPWLVRRLGPREPAPPVRRRRPVHHRAARPTGRRLLGRDQRQRAVGGGGLERHGPGGRIVAHLRGHAAVVGALAFSHDGRLLASGSDDETVRVYDVRSGQLVAVLRGHKGPVTEVAFDRTGRRIATASTDGSARARVDRRRRADRRSLRRVARERS